jgi:hypothetical protein
VSSEKFLRFFKHSPRVVLFNPSQTLARIIPFFLYNIQENQLKNIFSLMKKQNMRHKLHKWHKKEGGQGIMDKKCQICQTEKNKKKQLQA